VDSNGEKGMAGQGIAGPESEQVRTERARLDLALFRFPAPVSLQEPR